MGTLAAHKPLVTGSNPVAATFSIGLQSHLLDLGAFLLDLTNAPLFHFFSSAGLC
jgi:hypothetical protein